MSTQNTSHTKKRNPWIKAGRIFLKTIAWIFGIVVFLLLAVWFGLKIPAVQQFAKDKAVNYLQGKIGTPVRIDRIDLVLPKMVALKGVYFQDQSRDTLLYGEKLQVDIALLKLLNNRLEINRIDLVGITAKIRRNEQAVFNFDYIVKAFASKDTTTKQDSSAPMVIALDKINLDRIRIRYDDKITGMLADANLNHFDTRIKTFDLENQRFVVPRLNLNGLKGYLMQNKPLAQQMDESIKAPEDESAPLPDIDIDEINVGQINFAYDNFVSATFASLNLGRLEAELEKIDLRNEFVHLNKLVFQDNEIRFRLGKKEEARQTAQKLGEVVDTVATTLEKKGWRIRANTVDFARNNVFFDNDNSPRQTRGMDYVHLGIRELNLQAKDFLYSTDSIAGSIGQLAFRDTSGVQINTLRTDFLYAGKEAYLHNLLLETPRTKINREISIRYPSIAALSKNIGALYLNTDLDGSRIGIQDILYFVPTLYSNPTFAANRNKAIIINKGRLNGTIANLRIPGLAVRMLNNTAIDVSGSISGLPDTKKVNANLNIRQLQTGAADLNALLPRGTLPNSVRVPERIAFNGTVNGGMQRLLAKLNMNSSMGNGRVEANVANATLKGREKAGVRLQLDNFQLGRLLKQEQQFGNVSLRAQGSVYNFDPKKMTASLEAVVSSAQVKGYTYRNLNMEAVAKAGNYDVKARMADRNVSFRLDALADLNKKDPSVKATLDLDSINLQALNFTRDFLGLHGKVNLDLPIASADRLTGTVDIYDLLVVQPERRIVMDTIQMVANLSDTLKSIRLRSDIATASLTGNYTLTDLPVAIQQIVYRYYPAGTAPKPLKQEQRADFAFTVSNTKTLQTLVPNLQFYENVSITGSLNSAEKLLTVDAKIPAITYGENKIAPATLVVATRDSGLVYDLNLQGINNPTITVYRTRVNGLLANNNLSFALNVKDKTDRDKYALGGSMQLQGGENVLQLKDQLLLDYTNWTMNPANRIEFGSKGLLAQGFELRNNGQALIVNSRTSDYNSPILVQFQNFQIETLTKFVEKDTLLVGGAINGQAELINLQQSPQFTADLTIGNFNFRGDTLGNIAAKVNNLQQDRFAANVAITGFGNNVVADGFYYTNNPANAFDLNLNVERLNLVSVQGFTKAFANRMSGYINGQLKLTGTTAAPAIRGELAFKEAALNVVPLNSYYRMNNESISFRSDGIHFDQFTILDSASQEAVIDGALYTTDFRSYRFGLDVTTSDFRVLNSTRRDNNLYYGKLYLDSKIRIRGDLNLPVVNADLKINPRTSVTIVLPQSDPQAQSREGVVEFFDPENPEFTELFTQAQKDSVNQSTIQGLDVNASITIDPKAELSLVIDEANGDFVRVRGEGELSGGIDPSGKTTLTGVYELEEGAYEMTFQVLKRRFLIKKGSRLVWNGTPTDANVDITAVYKANTPPIDLVQDQIGSENRNLYKQRLPFDVNLNMKGELLKPEITFDIVLEDNNPALNNTVVNTVNTKLQQIRQQPTELNKQVFAVLLLNRFVSENPFASEAGGGGAEGLVRQSASKLLSEQLNNLAGGLIQGVDLNFDLESTSDDYTTGERANRTDLNVGVSKRLLNDRLNVTVGSNFGIEGPQQANQRASTIAGDIQVDYQLSKDGRYLLRAYRKDQYQVALQGQVVETGVGFILNLDYNKFREIFQRKPQNPDVVDDKKRKKAEKEAEKNTTTATK